jgi:hypothetical protein
MTEVEARTLFHALSKQNSRTTWYHNRRCKARARARLEGLLKKPSKKKEKIYTLW